MQTAQAAIVACGINATYPESDCDNPFPGIDGWNCWTRDEQGRDSFHWTPYKLGLSWFEGTARDWRLSHQINLSSSRVAVRPEPTGWTEIES